MKHLLQQLVWSVLCLAVTAGAQMRTISSEKLALGIDQTEDPAFPLILQNTSVMHGEAKIAIDVDEKGQLSDWLVLSYSRKEFADSALAAVKKWRFEPPSLNGLPWASVQELRFDFSRTGVVVSVTSFEALNNAMDELAKGRYVYRYYTLRELDRIPTPIKVVSPVAPPLGAGQTKYTVTVDFYIDEQGHVRLPSVGRDQASGIYAAQALDAVRQWLFEPPTVNGRPVLVSVRQDFTYLPKP